MLEKNKYLADFINILKDRGLVFNSKDAVSTPSTTTHTSTLSSLHQETITRLPDEDELTAVPSKAPDEKDLE